MNKKVFTLFILSLSFLSNVTFAAKWSAPIGYEKIFNPSQIKNYTNIIKAPNGIDLYGKRKNITNIDNSLRYLDKNSLLYYKGLLVKGSIDNQYYYVNTPNFLYYYQTSCSPIDDVCKNKHEKSYLRAVSLNVLKANNININNIPVVDQENINYSIFQLPINDITNNISLINNYKVCDFQNMFDLKKDINLVSTVSIFEGKNGKKTGDLSIADLVDVNCMKNDNIIKQQDCIKLESNGYKRLSSVFCSDISCSSVYEKNNKFYVTFKTGSHVESNKDIVYIYESNSIDSICK